VHPAHGRCVGPRTAGELHRARLGRGPVWSNYDENQTLSGGAQLRDTDWPIGVMVWNFADVNRVKNAMNNYYGDGDGGTKWLNIWTSSPSGETHDRDDGRKSPDVGSGCNRYHYDINENCSGAVFGFSETAEGPFIAAAAANGFPTTNDTQNEFNPICYPTFCQDGDPVWLNDGSASTELQHPSVMRAALVGVFVVVWVASSPARAAPLEREPCGTRRVPASRSTCRARNVRSCWPVPVQSCGHWWRVSRCRPDGAHQGPDQWYLMRLHLHVDVATPSPS
jgi:hypothetical protein